MQTPEHFVISYEMIHDTRIIPLVERAGMGDGIRQLLEDARGRGVGDTLIIDTASLTDRTSIGTHANGLPPPPSPSDNADIFRPPSQ